MVPVFEVVLVFFSAFLMDLFLYSWYSHKCAYDCSHCGYWPCPYHHCKRKREGDLPFKSTK